MPVEGVSGGRRNGAAAGLMLASALGLSLNPLLISLGHGDESPFLFNASLKLGLIIGSLFFLITVHWTLVRSRSILSLLWRRAFSWAILIAIIGNFEFAMFGWSTRFIDISVTTILYEIWPIFMILLLPRLYKEEERYRQITPGIVGLLVLCFMGITFGVFSQTGALGNLGGITLFTLAIGVSLALVSALLGPLPAFGFRWGTAIGRTIAENKSEHSFNMGVGRGLTSLELFGAVTAGVIANTVAIPINGVIGFVSGESLSLATLSLGVLAGITANAFAAIAWRWANLSTDRPAINAVSYAIPIFALIWLTLFSEASIARPDYLVIGVAAIIVANLLINFEADIRFGFKALMVALWICGVIVLLRDDFANLIGMERWLWAGNTSYFEALALSATIFILILSFRVARLVNRTTNEENRTFVVFQRLESLVESGLIKPDILPEILTIDESEQSPEALKRSYTEVLRGINEAKADPSISPEHKRLLSDATSDLNALVHSKQQGVVFGEVAALYIFAGITVAITLLSRPNIAGWTGFLVEMFATLFSAVIIFLLFNMRDLQQDRLGKILVRDPAYGGYGVYFPAVRSFAFEQWLSVIVGIALTSAYAWLLWGKWMG